MTQDDIITAEIIDITTLTLEDFATACAVEPKWIIERVEAGILGGRVQDKNPASWCFISADLARARQLIAIERDFEANEELAALVADLIAEIRRLKTCLKVAGLEDN